MSIKNEIMLITYADSLGQNLQELAYLLDHHLRGVVGGVHILPFYPSSADRGFAPMTYEEVDDVFGSWSDLDDITKTHFAMFDFMINHISRQSSYFKDFLEKKDHSRYADLFLRYKNFWPGGTSTTEDLQLIYKRKPRAPYVDVTFADGTTEKIWCTFDEEQIDLNFYTETTKRFIRENLESLVRRGASIIRLDAFAYATKKAGTNCFFVEPDAWEMLDMVKDILDPYGVVLLPEIHEHYSIQMKLAQRGYYVYDFALPMLVLHALYTGQAQRLANWLSIAPSNQFTTLDTHDGIGVVDVVDLLSEEEIEQTKEFLYSRGANVKKIYNSLAYGNMDIYQINCTYYSALGNDDDAYVLARAIQFFAPGIPQVYYVGLLAGENDLELLEETKVGRNINRHYYTKDEVEENLRRPVVQRLFSLMRFRNSYPAFDGSIHVIVKDHGRVLEIERASGKYMAVISADLQTRQFQITFKDPNTGTTHTLALP